MATITTNPRHRSFVSRPKRSAEVIVVGAGLSGLQTAYDLQQAGISCLVLEAQDRLGGRFRSVPCAGGRGVADFGAAWIDAMHHPRAANLVRRLGIDMVEENAKGESLMQGAGRFKHGDAPSLSDDDQRSYIRVRDNLEGLSQRVDLNNPTVMLPNYGNMNVVELVTSQGATPAVRKIAETWTSTMFGLAAKDVSALYFLLCCKTAGGFLNTISQPQRRGRRMRFRRGAQDLFAALAERLQPGSVVLSQAVQWIDQTSSNKVVLTTMEGEVFQCSRVVLAVPTAVYGGIEFSPALSEEKQWMQTYEQPGFYAEAVLVYDQPWWRETGLNGFAQSVEGPVWETRDTSSDADGFYALTCVIAGEVGRELYDMSEGERRETLLTQIGALYVDLIPFPNPIEIHEHIWAAEDMTRHVPCPAIPTTYLRTIAQNQWMAEDNIHFVGSEASHVWRGHIEGALASGCRGAEEVLAILRPVADELLAARL
ncbi:Fc.00g020040.m01.CDS01 [Cosmosporella sp. VM-42]